MTEGQANREPVQMTQIFKGLLISFFTILLFLGVIELAGYLWERRVAQGDQGWTLVASRRMPLERHGAADQPYYLFKTGQDYNWEGIPVHINSAGFRTEEFETPKPKDTFRILNIGDSVAFGWEVSQEETYGKQLEQMLNEREDGFHYEVINAGVPGWNLAMEEDFFLQEGLSYEPDMVLLDLTVVNDIYGKGPVVSEEPSIFDWLRDHSYGWPFLTTQARFLLARQVGPEAIPVLNPPKEARAYYPLDENNPVWGHLWDSILTIHEKAEERGIPIVIIAFPTAFQVNNANHPDTPQRVIAQRASDAGIEFVDMLPVYQQACQEAGSDSCEGYENLLFADVWMHPNVLGHRLAAEVLFERQ